MQTQIDTNHTLILSAQYNVYIQVKYSIILHQFIEVEEVNNIC